MKRAPSASRIAATSRNGREVRSTAALPMTARPGSAVRPATVASVSPCASGAISGRPVSLSNSTTATRTADRPSTGRRPPSGDADQTRAAAATTSHRRRTRRRRDGPAARGDRPRSQAVSARGCRAPLRPVHRRHEPVAALRQRLDVYWPVHVVAERLAQLGDGGVQAGGGVHEGVGAPQARASSARDTTSPGCSSSAASSRNGRSCSGTAAPSRHSSPLARSASNGRSGRAEPARQPCGLLFHRLLAPQHDVGIVDGEDDPFGRTSKTMRTLSAPAGLNSSEPLWRSGRDRPASAKESWPLLPSAITAGSTPPPSTA